jgi:hypothetical protein
MSSVTPLISGDLENKVKEKNKTHQQWYKGGVCESFVWSDSKDVWGWWYS